MFARLSLASLLLAGCGLLVYPAAAQPPAPPALAPPNGPPRVHADPGYHVGRVEYLCFRDKDGVKDAELVSVGSDRSARVWDLAPKGGPPRSKRAFFFPDIPSAAGLNPNNAGQYLAVGFYRPDGAKHPKVRVIDLNTEVPEGRVPHREVEVGDDVAAVSGVHFDHRGDHLMITGGDGNLWQWSDWNKPKAEFKRVPVPPLRGHIVTAVAFQSKSQWVTAAGFLSEKDAKASGLTSAHLCIAPFDGKNAAVQNGAPVPWRVLTLPGREPYVYSLDWHAEHGLAVGYFTQEADKLGHARVAVFPAKAPGVDEKSPTAVDLGVGFTSRVAWMPDGTLLATVGQDGFNPLPPEFLRVVDGKLIRVPRDDVFPGLDRHPVRQENGAGLNVCAAGTGDGPLALAWGGYAQGTIELARVRFPGGRKPELVSLDPVRRENWYTRMEWKPETGEIVLTGPGGRRTAVYDKILWGGTDLAEELTALPVWYDSLTAASTANRVVCRADLPEKRELVCNPFRLFVKPQDKKEWTGSILFPGVRSLLTFEKEKKRPNPVVALGSDGELTFWEYRPKETGTAVLKRTAAARLKEGQLDYHFASPSAPAANDGQKVFFKLSGADDVLVRTPPPPGAGDPQPADIVHGLDPDLVLPAGKHAFTVRAPHAGTLDVRVVTAAGAPRNVVTGQEVAAGDVPVAAHPFGPDDRAVEVTLRPRGGNRAITTRREIQVGKPGKVVLFDVTPQGGDCTESRNLMGPLPSPYCPTADRLAKILERLTGGVVERHSAAIGDGPHEATAASTADRLQALVDGEAFGADDCFILLLKGHGELYGRGPAQRAIFKTDGFKEAKAERGEDTGLSRDKLAELLKLVGTRTDKVVVILDCCRAENFLDALHARPITFYPCCLRGGLSEAVVLPDALAQILTRVEKDFPSGLVTQGDFLHVLREQCLVKARQRAEEIKAKSEVEWGYGAVPHRFVLANRTR